MVATLFLTYQFLPTHFLLTFSPLDIYLLWIMTSLVSPSPGVTQLLWGRRRRYSGCYIPANVVIEPAPIIVGISLHRCIPHYLSQMANIICAPMLQCSIEEQKIPAKSPSRSYRIDNKESAWIYFSGRLMRGSPVNRVIVLLVVLEVELYI